MKLSRRWATLAAAALLPFSAPALAADPGCEWKSPGPLVYIRDFGTLYVPRDAVLGAVIGTERTRQYDNREGGTARLECWWNKPSGQPAPSYFTTLAVPLAPPPPSPGGAYVADKLLQTNVPGIAVQFEHDVPLGQAFKTVDGGPAVAPHTAELIHNPIFPTPITNTANYFTVVKTGPLAAGPHQVNPQVLFTGTFSDVGHAFTFAAKGTVIVAQCDIGATGPINVDLGTWDQSDFIAPGFFKPETPFTLALHSCQDDPTGSVATVHAQFTPRGGSLPIGDPAQGIFSLGSGASAKGVGIRLLKDGSPMPLDVPVPIASLPSSGSLNLDFAAQIYQTESADKVQAGSVEGMLEFTLTYQ